MRIGSLFSGAGGLDMAVEQVFGGEVIWQSELDKAASTVLAHRFPCAPNLGDITAINWKKVQPVDVLCGGFPCQDVSAAGKRAGIKDGTRSGLWAIFADAIDQLRPPLVVIENVRGLLSARAHRNLESANAALGDGADGPVLRAAGAVLGDLADLGYDAQWATVAASSVGAPHRRERVFILAADTERRSGTWSPQCGGDSAENSQGGQAVLVGGCRSHSSYSPRDRRDEGRPESAGQQRGSDAALRSDGHVELLPTPCVVDRLATGEMTLEEWDESRRSQKERGVGSFGPRGDSLGAAILRVEEGTDKPDFSTTGARRRSDGHVELLPTPAAGNFNDGEAAEQWLTRQAAVKERLKNGNGMGMPLAIAVQLLPTPTTQDGANTGGPSQFERNTLPLNAEVILLPTPRRSDTNRAGQHGDGGMDLRTTVILLPTPHASQWGKYAAAITRWEQIAGPAPAPTEPNRNGKPRLNPAFSEWMMGWPAGWVTDPDIGISRNDQLRIVGNGVCPQQAVAALRFLLSVSEVAA